MARAAKLAKYRAKRDFHVTREPSGARAHATSGHDFVIQKHAARRLHYDFRLELDGVLLSWSVPKGPSLDPAQRRLAVRTEDHPLDYADFEGIIPKGEYGGGTVVVWDRGTWQPEGDPREGLRRGRLTFTLDGEKLHGRWHLVRTRTATRAESWLLFKSRDAVASDKRDVVAEEPASVVSGRTLEEVAADQDRVWRSDRAAAPTAIERRAAARLTPEEIVAQLPLGFRLTSLDKVLYPHQGITKGQLIAYLAVSAERILPHVANRPLTLVRCPEGHGKPCFYQKHVLAGSPAPIHHLPLVEESGERADYMTIDDLPGLVALAQLGTLEIHTWGSHADQPEKPDLMVFDLDPDLGLAWEQVALAAFDVRRRLGDLGLQSFVKTTGGKGLHVVAPVARKLGWDDFKQFTKQFAETLEDEHPDRYTAKLTKARRKDKIFIDYLRNGRGATFVAPYSPRARTGAPVALPIAWEELASGVTPAKLTTKTILPRLDGPDPWAGMTELDQGITAAAWRAVGGKP